MNSTRYSYEELKQSVLRANCSTEQLNRFKERYRNVINSTRTFNTIMTLCFLIKVLEKRDLPNQNKREILEDFYRELFPTTGNNTYNNVSYPINRYNNGYNRCNINTNATRLGFDLHFGLYGDDFLNNFDWYNADTQIPKETLSRVYYEIRNQLSGNKLKDFARELNCQERFIDDLDKIKNPFEKVYTVLIFGQNYEPRTWRSRLTLGLTRARRRDLAEKVNYLFDIGRQAS